MDLYTNVGTDANTTEQQDLQARQVYMITLNLNFIEYGHAVVISSET